MRTSIGVVPVLVGLCALAVAGTGTAVAATGQLVNITDPTSGVAAKVSTNGRLAVGDGSGPLTVDGSVDARPVLPGVPWNHDQAYFFLAGTTGQPFYDGLPGKRVALGNVSVTTYDLNGYAGRVVVFMDMRRAAVGSPCSEGAYLNRTMLATTYPADQTQMVFPVLKAPPTAPGAKERDCLALVVTQTGAGNVSVNVQATGAVF